MARPLARHSLLIDGKDVADADSSERRALRRAVQIVFQHPYGSLNPRQTVGDALMEPLLVNGEREGVYWYWTNRSRRWMVRSTRRS